MHRNLPRAMVLAFIGWAFAGAQSPAAHAAERQQLGRQANATKLSYFGYPATMPATTGTYDVFSRQVSRWVLETADAPAGGSTAIYSSSRLGQDEGIDARGQWALTYRRCTSGTTQEPEGCGLYEYSAGVGGFVETPIGTDSSARLPTLWGDRLAFVTSGMPPAVIIEDLSSGMAVTAEKAPAIGSNPHVDSMDLRYPLLAVAWNWRDHHGKHRTRIDLVNLQTGQPPHVIMRAGAAGQPGGQLISPTFADDKLYFALGGDRGLFYRYDTSTSSLRVRSAPKHLTSFVVGTQFARPSSDIVFYQTAPSGSGSSARCRTMHRPIRADGCRTWSIAYDGPFGGFH